MTIKVGDIAPDFTLTSQTGDPVSLKDFRSQKSVVLYFYPKDDTPGCTAESCAFRDSYQVFKDAGSEVIGVSSDSTDSHQKFASKYNLPFILLSDVGGQLRKSYEVPAGFFILPGRVTYIIDKEGVIRHIFNSQMNFKAHIDEALKTLKSMNNEQ